MGAQRIPKEIMNKMRELAVFEENEELTKLALQNVNKPIVEQPGEHIFESVCISDSNYNEVQGSSLEDKLFYSASFLALFVKCNPTYIQQRDREYIGEIVGADRVERFYTLCINDYGNVGLGVYIQLTDDQIQCGPEQIWRPLR